MVKVTGTKGDYQGNEVYSEIDLFSDKDLSKAQKNRIRSQVSDFLVNQTLNSLAQEKSPVRGAPYDTTLTKKYEAKKEAQGRGDDANLEFKGNLQRSLKTRPTDEGLRLGHFNNQAPKADGHNNLSGDSELPERRYLPKEGEQYKKPIKQGIEQIIANEIAKRSRISESQLTDIKSKNQFFQKFSQILQTNSRTQIRKAILTNDKLLDKVRKMGFLKYLNG